MKRIYFTLVVLLLLLSGMSYLYFSNLNTSSINSDLSLRIASQKAGVIFCIENNKSVLDILKGQELFNDLVGQEKVALLDDLKSKFLSKPAFNSLIDGTIYISFRPACEKRNIDWLITVQVNNADDRKALLHTLQSNKALAERLDNSYKIKLSDHSTIFLGMEKNVLLLSTSSKQLISALDSQPDIAENDFMKFIRKNDKLAKNSLASLYINYNQIPSLLKAITPYSNSGKLSVLNHQNAFAHFSYNFSKEKIFFSGETRVNDPHSYYALFTPLKPEKIEIDRILPDNTANYALYCTGDYKEWQKGLNKWLSLKKESKKIQQQIENINTKYHLNLNEILPKYTGSQFIIFQLNSKEKLAVVRLTNGDKVGQLLLDLSDNYSEDLKLLKEPDILYYYFGEPFKKFRKPYYAILNNYMFIANSVGALRTCLEKYKGNDLLINKPAYTQILAQLSNTANILFYFNNRQSQQITINTIYPAYYPHYRDPKGLKGFDSFIYQLSGDDESFQTNVLVSTKESLKKDTLITSADKALRSLE